MTVISLRKSTQILTLALVFVFTFKFFQSTPLERLFFQVQAIFLGLVLLFLMGYVVTILLNSRQINKVVVYYLLLIAIVPFYGAYRAGAEFGQPFIYGFLSERGWLLFGVGIWFYYVLVTQKLSFDTLKSAFVFMAWASLIVFSLFILTFDVSQLESYEEVSKLVRMTEYRGLRFKFQTYFITFGAIYYFIKYSVKKNPIDLLFLFLFLSYILFIVQGRTYMIYLAATFLLYYWLNYSAGKLMVLAIKLFLFLLFAIIAVQIIMPDYFDRIGYLFAQMLTVFSGDLSKDSSANARIFESLIVWNYFSEHPLTILLGTGSVSQQWNDGYFSLVGYFYPVDIGLWGYFFVYGTVGLLFIFLIPLFIAIKILKKIDYSSIFIVAIKYLLVFALVNSVHGSFYFEIAIYSIPMFILLAYLKLHERMNTVNNTPFSNSLKQNDRRNR